MNTSKPALIVLPVPVGRQHTLCRAPPGPRFGSAAEPDQFERAFAHRRISAKSAQPLHLTLATKPGDLPLRIIPCITLRVKHGVARAQLALNELQRLTVPMRFERLARSRETQR